MEDFYLSGKWRAKREKILRRDKYQCQRCRRYGRITEAKIVHHIKELEDYPELAFIDSNLESVCMKCHNILHPEKGTKTNQKKNKFYNVNDPYGGD